MLARESRASSVATVSCVRWESSHETPGLLPPMLPSLPFSLPMIPPSAASGPALISSINDKLRKIQVAVPLWLPPHPVRHARVAVERKSLRQCEIDLVETDRGYLMYFRTESPGHSSPAPGPERGRNGRPASVRSMPACNSSWPRPRPRFPGRALPRCGADPDGCTSRARRR